MRTRLHTLTALLVSVLLAGVLTPQAALAQVVDIPPPREDLAPADNWTYKLMLALAAGAVLLLLATVVGYVVKARGFKANAKRGGSK